MSFKITNPSLSMDGDLIEAAKENIQPLASGRRATALSAVLSTPHAQRESKLAAARNRLRINVEIALEDDDDNPLEAYCRLVYWTLENYPQGHSAESGLLELVEEATRVLKDHRGGIWRDDLRYLKLWVLYANHVEKPTVIYRFLLANEIGTGFALLYEEFSTVLERNGRCVVAPLFLFYHSDTGIGHSLNATQARGRGRNLSARHQPTGIPGRPSAGEISRVSEAHDACRTSGFRFPNTGTDTARSVDNNGNSA
jgi:Mad3/BUB1 homology region 1